MRINENIKLIGERVILVPYEAKHVEKYHGWMKNPELQKLTASEPLTLDEEYSMQRSWREDEDKCTFLIVSKNLLHEHNSEIDALVGDTNLFLSIEELDTNNEESATKQQDKNIKVAEAEIMIAEVSQRRQKLGWEAMLLMIQYGIEKLNIEKFVVKISEDNEQSIKMFLKMGFFEISKSKIFEEITMERKVNTDWINWINSEVHLRIEKYIP